MRKEDAGRVLADVLRGYMRDLAVEDGLTALGYGTEVSASHVLCLIMNASLLKKG